MGMFRIAPNKELEDAIEQMCVREERSAAKVREILLREAVEARGIKLQHDSRPTLTVSPKVMKAIKEDPTFNKPEKKITSMITPPLNIKHAKMVAPVDSCPHGYAKGMCKKAECNRKYQK